MALGAVLLSSVPAVPQAVAPPPVEAACGTNWTSRTIPPRTIRVLRTRSGKVQTVDFRRYVAIVMASGEWPSWLPKATLEAGAVATKQYAWYYALKGHHRSSYRSGSGACYDVRDDTNDQLFRPERAAPTTKQQRAIDRTWALTLRKRGRFFLTGYRAGTTSTCAADANGWKLYARSAATCARKHGWSSQRIQRAYFAPKLNFVWTPEVWGPALATPRVSLAAGSSLTTGPAKVRWRPLKGTQDVARYRMQRRVGGGSWKDVPLARTAATSASVELRIDRRVRFRVRGTDRKGRHGPWSITRPRKAVLRGPRDVTLSGSDTSLLGTPSSGRSRVARLRFTGKSIAYVAPTGPGMGRAIIKVNGRRVAVIDLEREQARGERLVWTRNWKRSRERVVVVKPADPAERVEIDGFLVLR
ncbi:hypothetical protein BH23CHL8_BH23CHL8_04800 [soil metagenome]